MKNWEQLNSWQQRALLERAAIWWWTPRIAPILVALVAALMFGLPVYGVWQQGLKGQAELRRAEQNRQIKIQEAKAVLESSTLLAEAEGERAKGVDAANQIIGQGLKGNEEYLRYLWITGLQECNGIVYIPTEAGIPILEAGRRPAAVNREGD